jgi:CubicO group peptidase (beta-lactamase class C family)
MQRLIRIPVFLALFSSVVLAQAPSGTIRERIPRFVNRNKTATESRVDWVGQAKNTFPLKEAGAPFTVSYEHNGRTFTLDEYFERTDVLGFLILRDDQKILERYLQGTGPADRYLSMSVSKSVVSVLVGVAVDEGKIRSVSDSVVKYLPNLKDSGYKDATVKDVLQMASGIEFSEEYTVPTSGIGLLSAASRTGTPTFAEFAASLRSEGKPGATFHYQSVNTQVLALVLEAATGIPLNKYAEQKLWAKIGTESPAFFLTGNKQPGICAYGCFYATLRDYARFGLMAMRGGQLTGERVVSSEWIRESATAAPFARPTEDEKTHACRRGYGYQWWIPCGEAGTFQAVGINGQAIYVNPAKRIVIAQFSAWPQPSASPEIRGESATVFNAIAAKLSAVPAS